ncbi:UNVERIFIED_CONTAM: hypothetical protein K2H54_054219 [Gekko kuhli]
MFQDKNKQYQKPGAAQKGKKTTPKDAPSNNKESPFCVLGTPAPRYSFPVILPPLPSREEYPNVYLVDRALSLLNKPVTSPEVVSSRSQLLYHAQCLP